MSDNVIPFGGASDGVAPPTTEPPQIEERPGQDVEGAKVALSHAAAVVDLLLHTFDESLGPLGQKDLSNLEEHTGLRDRTLITSLFLVLQEIDSARDMLDRVER
jgi:hypothetical protein